MRLQKKALFFILAFLFLITTGSTSVHSALGRKVDKAAKAIADDLKVDSTNTECHNCNLLKEDDLIFIELRKNNGNVKDQKNKKSDIYKVLRLLKSLHLDLYSDKVLYRYLDENGEYKNWTVREHNENALYNKLNPDKPTKKMPWFPEKNIAIVSNKLLVQKKHGIVNGYNDKALQKIRKSGLVSNALPMCTYKEKSGPMGVATFIVPVGISGEDIKKIKSLLNLSLNDLKTYQIQNLSRKEMLQLLQILCESKTVKKIEIACNGSIVNY